MKVTVITIVIGELGTKGLVKGLEDLEIREQGDHQDYSIKIGQNPKDLMVWFYGISTLACYSTPNPFLCK